MERSGSELLDSGSFGSNGAYLVRVFGLANIILIHLIRHDLSKTSLVLGPQFLAPIKAGAQQDACTGQLLAASGKDPKGNHVCLYHSTSGYGAKWGTLKLQVTECGAGTWCYSK
jgi:hypothetical protein